MHCSCCDRLLNDFESTRKSKSTGQYLDTCNKCMSMITDDVKVMDRDDFDPYEIPDDERVLEASFDFESEDDE